MDAETQRIIERTLERKKELEAQMNDFAAYFPPMAAPPTTDNATATSSNGVKRKSSSTNDENQTDQKQPDAQHSPTKKGSFGEKDRQTSGSIYPMIALEELKQSPIQTSDAPAVHIASATVTTSQTTALTELQETEGMTKGEAREAGRKARFAALAAHVDDFECDIKASACQRPKSDFMRGAAPRNLNELKQQPRQASISPNRNPVTTPANDGIIKKPTSVERRRNLEVRFNSPIAQIGISFDSSIDQNTTATTEDDVSIDMRQPKLQFIDHDAEEKIDEIIETAKIATTAADKEPLIERMAAYWEQKSKGNDKRVIERTRERAREIEESQSSEEMTHQPSGWSADENEEEEQQDEEEEQQDEEEEETASGFTTLFQTPMAPNKRKSNEFEDVFTTAAKEHRSASEKSSSSEMVSSSSSWPRQQKDVLGVPINGSQKSDAIQAFEQLIARNSPNVNNAPITSSKPIRGTPSYSIAVGPVRPFIQTASSSASAKEPAESCIVAEHHDVASLRSRWEVSSKSGTPLHPDRDGDELLEAAEKMAKGRTRLWPQRQHLDTASSGQSDGGGVFLSATFADKVPVSASCDEDNVESDIEEGDREEEEPEEETDGKITEEDSQQDDEQQIIDDVFRESLGGEDDNVSGLGDRSTTVGSMPSFDRRQRQMSPQSPPTTADEGAGDSGTLMHSVSFYRSQQKRGTVSGSSASVLFTPTAQSPSASNRAAVAARQDAINQRDGRNICETRIQMLNEAINIQQEQIAQASRALRYCHDKPEFQGSREEMDAQRALLLANERRRSLFTEFDRIKTILQTKDYNRLSADGPCGTLTISHIAIRLARDFINEHVNRTEGDLLYYFVVLLKHKEVVHSTQMVTSDEGMRHGSLDIPHYLQLTGLQHDFVVTLEVYSLRTRREMFTHAEKFQLTNLKGTFKKKTLKPKSSGSIFSPGRKPPSRSCCTKLLISCSPRHPSETSSLSSKAGFTSPGGPMAVLDPGFQRIAQLNLNLKAVNRGKFMFERFEYPLDGAVVVKLRCYADSAGAVEYRGFLSMYQKVSDLGSWTRYWCLLKDGQIRFWRYPDDEPIKEPIATVDLSRSVSKSVHLTDKEECARPHTFRLDVFPDVMATNAPSTSSHESRHHQRKEIMRILLSSDTRAECTAWCEKMNHTLRDIYLWNPDVSAGKPHYPQL